MSKVKPKRNKPTKYVNHDGWPELKKRLEKELMLFESFFEPNCAIDFVLNSPEACFEQLEQLYVLDTQYRIKNCAWIYPHLFKYFPIIKLKVSEQMLESWLITHSVDELKQLINYKD